MTADPSDDDPYLWLEDIDGARALKWVDAQTARTLARFGDGAWAADRDALRSLLDRPDNLPVPGRRGGLLYNVWRDAAHPKGLWRRTTLDSYRAEPTDWEILLDLDALAATEGVDWVWQGATTHAPDHRRAILRLSRGGGDAVVLREYDLDRRRFPDDGFHLEESKGGADWIDEDTLLLAASTFGATRSGYPSTVRLWRRGSQPGPAVHEIDPDGMGVWASFDRAARRVVFVERPGFFEAAYTLATLGPDLALTDRRRLDLPLDAELELDRDWLAVKPRRPWTVGGRTHAPDTLLAIRLDDFLAGGRDVAVLHVPAPRLALQGFGWTAGRLIASLLDDLAPVVRLFRTPEDGDPVAPGAGWPSSDLPGLPAIGTGHAWPIDLDDIEADGTLLASTQDPLTPATLSLLPPDGPPVVLRRAPSAFEAPGAVVTRHEAVSVDGARIPYVQVGPAGETGNAPVHLTGYGGFAVSSLPAYAVRTGKLWLERGGTTVIAQIRGGGEFGTAWHEAGRREGKRLAHDDFAAVAEDLVRRGVTVPARIAAEGGSNGGLLIANMLTRYPERFGALFCTIPLIDMRRYSRLLAGASWIAEYGDPDDPADWAFLRHISAYHAATPPVPGRATPPILLATARRDDRVHPGHARKMAARLQAMGHDAWFYEPAAGGHGYGRDNAEVAAFSALGTAFLRHAIGWS